jgi:hypothetical protein
LNKSKKLDNKKLPIENRQYIYTQILRLSRKEIIDRPLLDTSLGSWGRVYFIKTSPYLKQIFNWAIDLATPLVEKLKDFYIN